VRRESKEEEEKGGGGEWIRKGLRQEGKGILRCSLLTYLATNKPAILFKAHMASTLRYGLCVPPH
jgi:hypothetical protein